MRLKIVDELFWESQLVLLKIYETYCDPYTRKISVGSIVQLFKHFGLSPPLTRERVQALCDTLDNPVTLEAGDADVHKLHFPDFLEFVLRAAFEHVPPGDGQAAADPYPTVASKLYALLRHLRQTFAALFREAPVPLVADKQYYPVVESVWIEFYPPGYISVQAMKDLGSAVPTDRRAELGGRKRVEGYIGPAGTSLTFQGRHFSRDHGLYVRFGDAIVHARVSSTANAHVEVPPQLCDRMLLELRDIPDELGRPVHTAVLSGVRTTPTVVSTFRMVWSPAPRFTYQSPQQLFPIHDRFHRLLRQIFGWYCDQRDGGGNAGLLYLEEWLRFKWDFQIREPNPDTVVLSLDRLPPPPGSRGADGGPASHEERHASLFPVFATCHPGSKEPQTPALGFEAFLRLTLLSQVPHGMGPLLVQASAPPAADKAPKGSSADLKQVRLCPWSRAPARPPARGDADGGVRSAPCTARGTHRAVYRVCGAPVPFWWALRRRGGHRPPLSPSMQLVSPTLP